MSDVDFKNALLAGDPDAPVNETAEVPSHAGPITIRPLRRDETLALKTERAQGMTIGEWECHMLSKALVHPAMTPAEVALWQASDKAGGLLERVIEAVTELSGLGEGADKSRVQATRT